MLKSAIPNKADPGVENSMEWLSAKIVECMVSPMSEDVARSLAIYNAAYRALARQARKNVEADKPACKSFYTETKGGLTTQEAKKWCNEMVNADGTIGPHWDIDKTKQIQAQRNISGSPAEFWAAMNATYSDLCMFFKKYGISTIDVYVDYVKAFWTDDEDAVKNKLKVYYENIAQH